MANDTTFWSGDGRKRFIVRYADHNGVEHPQQLWSQSAEDAVAFLRGWMPTRVAEIVRVEPCL